MEHDFTKYKKLLEDTDSNEDIASFVTEILDKYGGNSEKLFGAIYEKYTDSYKRDIAIYGMGASMSMRKLSRMLSYNYD